MVANNKVLTVSYGTFSCTLEGFDESFDTMKAIAEYFRDLAADDRYFGAEPPTPDAEMLTRIAEREIERRVQARHEGGAIVLSATDPAPIEPAQQPIAEPPVAEAMVPATPEVPALDLDTDFAPEPQEVIIQTADDDTTSEQAFDAEPQDEEPLVKDVVAAAQEEMEIVETVDLDDDNMISEIAELEDNAPTTDDIPEAAPLEVTEESENLFKEAFDIIAASEEDQPDSVADFAEIRQESAPVEDAPQEDSIAAKLRRIRAVVSRVETENDDEDDFIEDQHADEPAPDSSIPAEVFAAETSQDISEDNNDRIDELEDDIQAPEILKDETPEPVKPRARIIRMKRADFDKAVADGALEEETDEDNAPLAEADAPAATDLSDQDEADLLAELAEVDAEIDLTDSPIPAAAKPVKPARRNRKARAQLDQAAPEEGAVDRLIDETNTKLDEPEGNRRRSAIAHLRAAVAATKAEKAAGKSLKKTDHSEVYRDDLESVVRPRGKSDDTSDASPRKSAAPLKLVPAQRINASDAARDTPTADPASGVRPRRVSPEDLAAIEANAESSDFVEFAENMGATQLPEVLEAAASYLTFVEGRNRFSRPMVMRLAYQVGEQRFEREAGLRSFGQLLRDKKIEKIAGGRFTVSESINFKPGDRAAS
ncbi:hypothetical protein NBRC116601_03240 [Cognatishimia sp. WU-CL00825]|uniref:hypothetical protein n=1 Tax=Cognatishimia sp. WU-CL00825 TaxID=3127658 RepID=UPI003101F110